MSLFSRITGMFCRASEPDIEDEFDPLDDEEWDDEGDLRVCYPPEFDPLDEGEMDW
jgi:hypothetical protein